jgi:protein phosphatase
MVEVGQLTAEEALTHQNRNVLYRAIGQANTLEAEVDLRSLPAQGQLLLCSDGLWNLVLDDEIIQVLKESSSLDESVNQLVALANQKGGDDNITVVLIAAG